MTTFGPDHATDIIETMVGGLDKPFYVNTFNRGAVTNMADDAFLELLCDVDADGPRPQPVGEMPRGLRGLQEQVLDTHELTAEAVVTCDRRLLRRAMLTDPLVSSLADADAILPGDYNLPHSVAWVLAGEERASEERMLELLEPYRGHRFRMIRLIWMKAAKPPRRGPKRSRRRPAQ